MSDNTIMKSTELTQKGINLINKIYDKVFCIFSNTDFGYDNNDKSLYDGTIISIQFAVRNKKLDWFTTIQIGECVCVNVWSEDFPNKVFFDKESSQRVYEKECL